MVTYLVDLIYKGSHLSLEINTGHYGSTIHSLRCQTFVILDNIYALLDQTELMHRKVVINIE